MNQTNPKDLKPNSAAWLEELARTDPTQAAHTRAIVAAAGSEEVCQICGDAPARDFTVQGVALRARFCDDCARLQGAR